MNLMNHIIQYFEIECNNKYLFKKLVLNKRLINRRNNIKNRRRNLNNKHMILEI